MTEPGSTEPDTAEPTLRKDAALNRERLIEAGRDLFAKRGLSATLNDVARHAGLGVGTAYRRFANKDELIDAILERQNQEMEGVLRSALTEPDPWDGLVLFLERSTAMQARDRGMAQIFTGRHSCNVSYDETRDRLAPLVDEVAARARNSGQLRADVTGTDLIFIQVALSSVAAVAQDGHQPADRSDTSELYRRYLWIALDGLRADRDPSPLPVPPLSVDDTHELLRTEA